MTCQASLNNSAILRLKNTLWSQVEPAEQATLEHLSSLMSSKHNFSAYRTSLETCPRPKLPYFGIIQKDLFSLTSVTPKLLHSRKDVVVNFLLYQRCASIIRTFEECKDSTYKIFPSLFAHKLLSTLPSYDNDQLYEISKRIEPPRKKLSIFT